MAAPASPRLLLPVRARPGLFPPLTAEGNAALLARHLGWDEARVRARLAELSGLVRLAPVTFRRYPRQLSCRQPQKTASRA